MPFAKIKTGKNKGKYRSPSGRVFSYSQVKRYYSRGQTFDAATQTRLDPSGTMPLQKSLNSQFNQSWQRLKQQVMQTVGKNDNFGLKSANNMILMNASGGSIQAFHDWFDRIQQIVLGPVSDILKTGLGTGYDRGARYAQSRVNIVPLHITVPGSDLIVSSGLLELQGLLKGLLTVASRVMADALAQRLLPMKVARSIGMVIDKYGVLRSKLLVATYVMKAFTQGSVDAYRQMGITSVGTIPEHEPGRVSTDCAHIHDMFNPNEPRDPQGRWTGIEHVSGNVVSMHPQTFLNLAMPFGVRGGRPVNRATVEYFKSNQGGSNPMLSVKQNEEGGFQVGIHDGRHRALAALESGKQEIHVDIVRGKKLARENPHLTDEHIAQLISQHGLLPEHYGLGLDSQLHDVEIGRIRFKVPPSSVRPRARVVKAPKPVSTRQRVAAPPAPVSEQVNVQTAGDSHVCPVCESISRNGPYSLDRANGLIPAHPRCRCTLVPV